MQAGAAPDRATPATKLSLLLPPTPSVQLYLIVVGVLVAQRWAKLFAEVFA